MAESKQDKHQKSQDSFADDLDSMLNLDEMTDQEVGLVDDDDAIDKLLMGDVFDEPESEAETTQLNAIDQLLADDEKIIEPPMSEFDEFGDDIDELIADIQIKPKDAEQADIIPFDGVPDEEVDLAELETVGEVDEFAIEEQAMPEIELDADDGNDLMDGMAEIDELSAQPSVFNSDNADFLIADFDISALDEPEFDSSNELASKLGLGTRDGAGDAVISEPEADLDVFSDDSVLESSADSGLDLHEIPQKIADEVAVDKQPEPDISAKPDVDYAALIAGLTSQVDGLLKQQGQVKREIQLKSSQEELTVCKDTIDTLQTEQKKAKRNIDTLINKKPVSAYVANGIAIVALIVGGSLGYQGYVAKSQTAQIIEYLGKMQAQINAAPTADAAEKEMLRNQLDEIARVNSVNSTQIAELTESLLGKAESGKPVGEIGKQFNELSNQNMQMGAAIETLQNKVAALEKGKTAVAPAKPTPKKMPVMQDNWVVNLVAFKQDWYARRKAEEYVGKGVPAKVIRADTKGEIWYRLSVDGFKSQSEATAYAARVKKTFNLDSVWVNKTKP